MNREDIIRMAREAGWAVSDNATDEWIARQKRFAALVAAAERGALLDLVDDFAKNNTDLKDAIRARGQA